VLEAYEAVNCSEPQIHCGRAIAERLVANREARRVGKRLIQMVSVKARDAIQRAKAARDAVLARIAVMERTAILISTYFDGPLGRGNLLPFARTHTLGDKLHYEIPRAGDTGIRRHNLFRRRDDNGIPQLESKQLRVSSRNLFAKQPIPAVRLAV